MKKGHFESEPTGRHRSGLVIGIVIAAVLITAACAFYFCQRPDHVQAQLPGGQDIPEENVEKNTDSISIPGYAQIELAANQKKQSVGLHNPAQNTCWFRITLFLPDGTELWQSDLIAPGEISDPIVLNRKLEAGKYPDCVLRYDCYAMNQELTQLNGAQTVVCLEAS